MTLASTNRRLIKAEPSIITTSDGRGRLEGVFPTQITHVSETCCSLIFINSCNCTCTCTTSSPEYPTMRQPTRKPVSHYDAPSPSSQVPCHFYKPYIVSPLRFSLLFPIPLCCYSKIDSRQRFLKLWSLPHTCSLPLAAQKIFWLTISSWNPQAFLRGHQACASASCLPQSTAWTRRLACQLLLLPWTPCCTSFQAFLIDSLIRSPRTNSSASWQ